MQKKKICFITAAEITVKVFLVNHLKALSTQYDVSVVTNTNNSDFLKPSGLHLNVIPLFIERTISPIRDINALFRLIFLFRKCRFEAVHSVTPKAGLLSMLAAFFVRIPVRIHTFTGQVWATRSGAMRCLLLGADRLITFCATHILVDSCSQRDFLIKENVVSESKSHIIANGSVCGVDTQRFAPNYEVRKSLRKMFLIDEFDVVFLFLGRLAFDKGLLDLTQAFVKVSGIHKNVQLIIVGPDEDNMKQRILVRCESCSDKVHFDAYTDKPETFMAAADVFCLPSYREGFGMTIIEAGSVGIPSIGTRIYGITDAIEEGATGFLYTPRDVNELTEKMLRMIEEPDMRKEMGIRARERVIRLYSKEIVTSAFVEFYDLIFSLESVAK
ncbi:MAG: glycosyltransferase family 4 protein [Anaerolineaceae bacterium]